MDRSSAQHTRGRRPLLTAVLVVLTLGGLVHAAGDDGPRGTVAVGASTRPAGPTTPPPPPAEPSAGAPGGAAPAGQVSPPGQPPASPVGPGPAEQPPGSGSSPGDSPQPEPMTAGDGTVGPQVSAPEVPAPAPANEAQAAELELTATLASVAAAGAQAGGTIDAVVLGSDGRELLATPGAGVPAWTASLSKTFVVQQLLAPDGARPPLAPEDLRLLERVLTVSDDSAMDTLWVQFDGPALVTAAAADFGLTGTAAPTEAGQWGQATTTARDYAAFLHRLRFALDDAALAAVTRWLQSTADRAADGFDQTFGLRSGAADTVAPVGAKQGWMCCVDGRRQLHSAGSLADGRTIVLLGDFPASTSWAAAHTALDQAAQAVVAGP